MLEAEGGSKEGREGERNALIEEGQGWEEGGRAGGREGGKGRTEEEVHGVLLGLVGEGVGVIPTDGGQQLPVLVQASARAAWREGGREGGKEGGGSGDSKSQCSFRGRGERL